ncbi:FGGY-family carbohydrate kinase [Methylophaga sp. OBS4]|uniref:FGGY-family carbohydrate kinase n=1 Tax=Methylophaga sp. OBS4 TaxID=2991935 RepID=UPI00225BC880|nr:FGGY-family carbohydrate kinase [Methylophaga sp. OBS4]MCX4186321.1 FGGY-family carbohydrate kinase [Methylophaga sp. OBS4]
MLSDAWIGIDLGTSGCRAVVINAQDNIVAQQHLSFPPSVSTAPASEQNPQQQWQYVKQLLLSLLADLKNFRIRAISVDATSGSILLTDKQGRPLTPLLMYDDARAKQQAEMIGKVAAADSAAHGVSSGLAKLLYLQQQTELPTDYQLMHQADWILFKLGAELGVTDYNNALKTGFDPVQLQWPSWLDTLIDTNCLPRVVSPGTVIGNLIPELQAELRLTYSPELIAGTTDSIAALLATGASKTGEAVTSLGSTLVLKLIADRPVYQPEHGIYSHKLGALWLTGGASNTGGAVLRHFFSDDELSHLSQQIDLNQTPPTYYPLLTAGERFPFNNPQLEPLLSPRPANDAAFLHGLLTAMADIEMQGYHLLTALAGCELKSVRTTGGGAENKIWQCIRQQKLKVPLLELTQTEAAFGTALLAKDKLKNY